MGKSQQKETLKKQFGRTAWFAKKSPYWRDVAINFQKSLSNIIQWKIIPTFIGAQKNLKKFLCKTSKHKVILVSIGKISSKRNIEKEPLDFQKRSSLERGCNKFWKVFVKNYPMKNHANFVLGKRTKKEKKHLVRELRNSKQNTVQTPVGLMRYHANTCGRNALSCKRLWA